MGAAAGVNGVQAGSRVRGWLTLNRRDPTQVVLRRTIAYLVDALLIADILLLVIWITGDVRRASRFSPFWPDAGPDGPADDAVSPPDREAIRAWVREPLFRRVGPPRALG